MTALMVFCGLSFCASLMIVGAVMLNARRAEPTMESSSEETTVTTQVAPGKSSVVPAYGH